MREAVGFSDLLGATVFMNPQNCMNFFLITHSDYELVIRYECKMENRNQNLKKRDTTLESLVQWE